VSAPPLTIVSAPGCHLCHDMAEVVRLVIGDRVALVEADVRSRPEWRQYRFEIPVLLLGEREIARHRIEADELRRRLAAAGVSL
jgi:hypothetical protein